MRTAAAATGLLLGLVLAGCSEDEPASTPTPGTPESTSYVAMGDSYTAAPLISDDPAADGCLRSSTNYPALVAQQLGYDLTDVSCSGATTENLRTAQTTSTEPVPPQLDALSEDTDVVTIGMGGNDDGVFQRMLTCAGTGSTDASCRGGLEDSIDGLGAHLTEALDAIRSRAPEAEVVVVGYPQILGAGSACPDRLPVAQADLAYFAGLNERLHRVQADAAATAGTPYVDLYDYSAGHDICSEDPWVNGIETTPGIGLAFHPLAAGQQAAAELVVEALAGQSATQEP
jgi:lysophospholipase L1-like esterase